MCHPYILTTIRTLVIKCGDGNAQHRFSKCGAHYGNILSGHFTFSKREQIKRKVYLLNVCFKVEQVYDLGEWCVMFHFKTALSIICLLCSWTGVNPARFT